MTSATDVAELSARYRRFAEHEAQGRSPSYAAIAETVAGDEAALAFLMTLPREKRQPNLLLAAVRHLYGASPDWPSFRCALFADLEAVRVLMLSRSTQTNEAARCAVFLPLLAQLPQPLALIEVGASAGLCLLPDLYGYRYGQHRLAPADPLDGHPVFACAADAATPIPTTMPRIVWRAGLDLNPLDASDPDQAAWLETLVWPEQADRLANLRAALRIAALRPPRIVHGNLLRDDLARLCRQAPPDVTLVVFHTAVLAYVPDQSDRDAFARTVLALCRHWISNEAPGAFPAIAEQAGEPPVDGRFLMSLNGSPVAWTDPHGAAMEWVR